MGRALPLNRPSWKLSMTVAGFGPQYGLIIFSLFMNRENTFTFWAMAFFFTLNCQVMIFCEEVVRSFFMVSSIL